MRGWRFRKLFLKWLILFVDSSNDVKFRSSFLDITIDLLIFLSKLSTAVKQL